MKNILLSIIICFTSILTFAQSEQSDKIKMKVLIQKEPLPGTSIIIEDTDNPDFFTTDFDGEVEIIIPKERNFVRLSFLGPIVRVKILRPTDSIVVDLDSKKATYYNKGKKLKKRKIKVSGY